VSAETVVLHIPDGEGSVIVAREESSQPLKVSAPTGFRMPPHAGAVAKVLEAFDPAPRTRPEVLPTFTGRSITQPDRWERELDRVRRAGFALDDMEFQEGIRAVSVPVLLARPGGDELAGAYSIVAVASRVSVATLREWVPALLASARGLAEALRQSRQRGAPEGAR
jgi:IclR family acetate operon transcriptional repressor